MSVNKIKVNNAHFSVRVLAVCKNYNFTTVGQLSRLVSGMKPNAKLSSQFSHIRAYRVQREIDDFTAEYNKRQSEIDYSLAT